MVQALIYSEKLGKHMKDKRGASLTSFKAMTLISETGALNITQLDLNGRLRQIAGVPCVFSSKMA